MSGARTTQPDWLARTRRVRGLTEALCEPLAIEDFVVQTMPDVSPVKWHLAHTSWFFETFILKPGLSGYRPFDDRFEALFNSYYNAVGEPWPRAHRGLLSRPTVTGIRSYRKHVDTALEEFLASPTADRLARFAPILELGLNHEEQHQELILTDVKHVLSVNPSQPAYRAVVAPVEAEPAADPGRGRDTTPLTWTARPGGLVQVGSPGDGFAFDNERPRHRVHLEPFAIADRLVTSGEFADFIADGGYGRPDLWLADGWDAKNRGGWQAPLYWTRDGDGWLQFTLSGSRPVERSEPACHVSYYEADAFARWAGARLPREEEWEEVAAACPVRGNFLDSGRLHPGPAPMAGGRQAGRARQSEGPAQLFGDVWEWTASPYLPYPGYVPFAGALGEYNGKFMVNQLVLRGGSCVTPDGHVRPTYRNFFPPETRWQFSGLRLARG